ncbi:hypothetical protein QM480_08290 [Flectobacillus sp. DC10W]|uniref:Uncharacterized protein n=1 Tax=Flectobacillus longus TaxID=2984207 RepID=A0ABT6YL51_9BACT|nr:hypothetical protein [Flectobacillus longus]MDI9864321.1 hypothetical protein [Flectobacillus longus]
MRKVFYGKPNFAQNKKERNLALNFNYRKLVGKIKIILPALGSRLYAVG